MKNIYILLMITLINSASAQAMNTTQGSLNNGYLDKADQSIQYLEDEMKSIDALFTQPDSTYSKAEIGALITEKERLTQLIAIMNEQIIKFIATKEIELKTELESLVILRKQQKKLIIDSLTKENKRRYLTSLVKDRKDFLDRDRDIADLIKASQTPVQTQSAPNYRTLPIFSGTRKLPIIRRL